MEQMIVNTEEHGPNDKQLLWYDEIVRETDHYYQGEMQHDQRSSWLLTTSAVLIALVVGSNSFVRNTNPLISILLIGALSAFVVSAFIAVATLLPLRGTRFWGDFAGKSYRCARSLTAHQLLEEKFRHNQFSYSQYEKRIEHHFRSHYLRASSKAYGVLWSSLILIVGIVLFAVAAILILI